MDFWQPSSEVVLHLMVELELTTSVSCEGHCGNPISLDPTKRIAVSSAHQAVLLE